MWPHSKRRAVNEQQLCWPKWKGSVDHNVDTPFTVREVSRHTPAGDRRATEMDEIAGFEPLDA